METDPQTSIALKTYSPEAADDALTRALRGKQGRLTKADAITLSGLPSHMVDESLDRLLHRYKSRLEVTDDGELLYSFDPSMTRRDEITFGERMREVGHKLARVGMWVFKAWITVTLIVYLVAFILLVLGVMFGGDDRRRDRGRGGGDFGWLIWFLLPDWRYGGYGYGYGNGYNQMSGARDPWGRTLPPAQAQRTVDGKPKKKFIQSVFDFVFGPPLPAKDKLTDEREILAYVRAHDGRITATDLVQLHGWSYRKSEEEVTRLLIDYDGEPEVTDEGVIVYEFPKLLKSANEVEALAPANVASVVPKMAWERLEPTPPLTGNTSTMDWVVGLFGGFNLFISFFAAHWASVRYGLGGPGWHFFFTTFPLTFFALFLGIPGVRTVAAKLGAGAREKRNRQRQLVKDIVQARGPLPSSPELHEVTLAFEGEPDVDAAGNGVIKFPRPPEEREALAKYLKGVDAGAERRIGKVIFGGDDDEVNKIAAENDHPRLKG